MSFLQRDRFPKLKSHVFQFDKMELRNYYPHEMEKLSVLEITQTKTFDQVHLMVLLALASTFPDWSPHPWWSLRSDARCYRPLRSVSPHFPGHHFGYKTRILTVASRAISTTTCVPVTLATSVSMCPYSIRCSTSSRTMYVMTDVWAVLTYGFAADEGFLRALPQADVQQRRCQLSTDHCPIEVWNFPINTFLLVKRQMYLRNKGVVSALNREKYDIIPQMLRPWPSPARQRHLWIHQRDAWYQWSRSDYTSSHIAAFD